MNLNLPLIKKKRDGFGFAASNVKQFMGPPIRPPPRTKSGKNKTNSSTSSGTNWGKSCLSVINTSTLRSGSTTFTTDNESRVIVALTEGRGEARCEVGLASIDLSSPTILLCQISDSQTYINTLTKINIVNPTDIIVPSTFLENQNRLIKKLTKKFPNVKILGIPRKTFNKTNGMDQILQLCLPSVNTICVGLQHKYYALAAASALITYLRNNLNIYYVKGSINVIYQESEGYAIIADRLELVSSTKPHQASRYATLFGVLNYCVTKVGSRLLRSTILQPPCLPSIIEVTLHSVSELIKHPEVLHSIQSILQKLSNIDQLLTLTSVPLGTTDNSSVRQLNYLLMLNGLIDVIDPLKEVIQNLQQPFFKQLKNTLESENFVVIADKVRTKIHPSASFAKSEAETERCFAIKSNINGLLDLVRKTYAERLDDLKEYVRHLGNKYNLPLTLGNNNAKGYHLILKLNQQQKRTFKKSDLPSEFVQVCRLAGSCTMKTEELINYSTRLEDIMVEILKISNSMIYALVVDLKQYMGFFYKLCEDVARLDMVQSLAEASKRGNYVRPKFGDFTELANSRHPMLEMLVGSQSVANPISICKDFNVQIITGPNGSGKSVYIRQIMLLQVMAQVGCYVPADSAIFRPMQRMFARIYLEDDMEYGASSFILEMKEIKYMMNLPTENSLFIVDEMCRSTAADEGTSIALAICEQFCVTPVFLYVTTHYKAITNLASAYFNVKTWHMETEAVGDTPQELVLNFKYHLIPGVTNLKHYGVHIVKKIWPQSLLQKVYIILDEISGRSEDQQKSRIHDAGRLKYKLEADFRKLKSLGKLTRATINKLLNDYQNSLQKGDFTITNLSLDEQLDEFDIPIGSEIDQDFQENDNFCCQNDFSQQNDADYGSSPSCSLECGSYESQNVTNDSDNFETSSYRNLSNFLREDSDNVNKLIPEVCIASSERQFFINQENEDNREIREHSLYQEVENIETDRVNGDQSINIVAPTLWGMNIQDISAEELKSIMDEFESASRSLIEDDDFDFSGMSASQTENNKIQNRNQNSNHQHIFPVVNIANGPSWSSDSSEKSLPDLAINDSISYSPLCSQLSVVEAVRKEISTSSSLPFVTKDTSENAPNSDINLENLSRMRDVDNITVENLRSLSSEKATSDDRTNPQKASTSSSLKESDSNESAHKETIKAPKFQKKRMKFKPPKKLTRQEIEEEFKEQDRRLYESDLSESDLSKYLQQKLNRPSVKQLQNSKHLAFVRKTDTGVEVFPVKNKPVKPKFPFKRNLSSSSPIDMSIFSDKNARCLDEFLNSNERDVKRFKFNFDSKSKESDGGFNFQPQSISEYSESLQNRVFFCRTPVNSLFEKTSDGYYKQNKQDINNIMDKYLGHNSASGEDFQRNDNFNMFETCLLNENDLDL